MILACFVTLVLRHARDVIISGFNKIINKRISELTESFVKNTNYEFECSEITGRKFQDIDEHSAFVDQGGCAELIEAIAEVARQPF